MEEIYHYFNFLRGARINAGRSPGLRPEEKKFSILILAIFIVILALTMLGILFGEVPA